MTGKVLSLLLIAGTLLVLAQDKVSSGKVLLVRAGGSETPGKHAVKDVSGTWTGAIRIRTRSIPICLVLRYNDGNLIGTFGPDPEHQAAWPITAIDGVVRFRPDTVSEIRLRLADRTLVGEITKVVSDARANAPLPDETVGFDRIVPVLISVFDHTDILALGESGHRRKVDSDLRIQLIRDPEFVRRVRFIVVEFGDSAYQSILDRYIQGEDVPLAELQQVWEKTTQVMVWNSPVYADFFAAVRGVNRKLPRDKRIRVLAGDPSPDSKETRNSMPASLLKDVLDKSGKALLLYGGGHLDRYSGIPNLLQGTHPGRLFVVDVMGGADPRYQKFEDALKSRVRPVLVSLRRPPFRDFKAADMPGHTRYNTLLLDGEHSLGQLVDACIYLGMAPDVETIINPAPWWPPLDLPTGR